MFPHLPVQTSTECTRTDTLNSGAFFHKPIATPSSTLIAAADNQFLPPLDDDDENDADTDDLMGKYNGGGKEKVKWVHCRRYREDDNIEAHQGVYKEPKDNNDGRDNDDNDGDWEHTEEK